MSTILNRFHPGVVLILFHSEEFKMLLLVEKGAISEGQSQLAADRSVARNLAHVCL